MLKRVQILILILFFFLPRPASTQAQSTVLGAVASQHPLASQAGARVLRQGGNAVDAAVAVALTLAVVEPYNSGLGAGGMALVWDGKKKKAHALDFREKAPATAHEQMFQQAGLAPDASREGPMAIAVPGEVKGLWTMHQRWGKLPWKDLFVEAVRFSEEGFPGDSVLQERIRAKKDCLSRDYHSWKIYRPLWKAPSDLETLGLDANQDPEPSPPVWLQKDLARTLKRLRDEGGEDFYQGEIAKNLLKNLRAKGALLSEADLLNYEAVERAVLAANFPWGKVWAVPLPSSGGISLLRGLNTLEALQAKSPQSPGWIPWMVEVLGRIFKDRNSLMGDKDFTKGIPEKKWTSKSFAKKEAKTVLKEDPFAQETPGVELKTDGQTTHLSVMDLQGWAVSMTLTHNLSFGSCVTAGETGVLMNDQMDDFSTRPGLPNAFGLVQSTKNIIAGGKRPLSSIAPTLVTQNKNAILAIGAPGGPRIISTLLLVLHRYFVQGETMEQAVKARRFHFQDLPKIIFVEKDILVDTQRKLKALGLPVVETKPWSNVQWVTRNPLSGEFSAQSDPRGMGLGLVVRSEGRVTVE